MKSVSRNKFLHCFRPMADMDMVIESNSSDTDGSSDLGFSCIGLEDKKDVKTLDSNSGAVLRPPKRTLSRVLKAVLFETILVVLLLLMFDRDFSLLVLFSDGYKTKFFFFCVVIFRRKELVIERGFAKNREEREDLWIWVVMNRVMRLRGEVLVHLHYHHLLLLRQVHHQSPNV